MSNKNVNYKILNKRNYKTVCTAKSMFCKDYNKYNINVIYPI